ncbi:MAG: PmbA protein [Gammaproteobacteria bacterium]|jgi:PmbA protein
MPETVSLPESQPLDTPIGPNHESLPRLRDLTEAIIALGKSEGASAVEAAASCNAGLSVNVRLGAVETIEHTRDKGMGVTVYIGQRKGSASTSDFSAAAVRQTVRAACEIARHASEDPHAGLAEEHRLARDPIELELFHPWDLAAEEAITIATEVEDAARTADARISNSEGASVSRSDSLFVYGNSHGFLQGYPSSRQSLSCSVIAGETDSMQRDYWYSVARNAGDLQDPQVVGQMAAQRTVARLNARQLSTRETAVVYSADVARGLFQHFVSAVRGASQFRKATFLHDQAGKQVFPEFMRLHEQPHLLRALGSCSFDGEGVATAARDLVTDGVLRGYVLDSYSARQLKLQTTGNAGGVHNLTVEPNAGDLNELLAQMGNGLLITELMGFGINGVTGDYSRGASGFWIENGSVAFPVEEITVAGNLRDIFMGIRCVGNDIDARGNIRCGSVLVDRMTVAGNG